MKTITVKFEIGKAVGDDKAAFIIITDVNKPKQTATIYAKGPIELVEKALLRITDWKWRDE